LVNIRERYRQRQPTLLFGSFFYTFPQKTL
jgi:hypothetical protein